MLSIPMRPFSVRAALMFAAASLAVAAPPRPGEPFPDFTALELGSGRPISARDFRGKVVLIDFWATWCGPCIASIPKLKQLDGEFAEKDFEIIGFSLDRDEDALKRAVDVRKLDWKHVHEDPLNPQSLARQVQVTRIPRYMLIGRDGKLLADNIRSDELHDAIKKALAAPRPPDEPTAVEAQTAPATKPSEPPAGAPAETRPSEQTPPATSRPAWASSRPASVPANAAVPLDKMTDKDRERALRWIQIARALAQNGNNAGARQRCERLLQRYPESHEAAEARKLLESLGEPKGRP